MLSAVFQAMSKNPIQTPEKACFTTVLTIDVHLTTFQSMIPTKYQAILLGFQRILDSYLR